MRAGPAVGALLAVLTLLLALAEPAGAAADRLRVGVTLHPYYSWVANIAGDRIEVVPLLAQASDPHSYQPQPQDLQRLATLRAVVVNGLGHDAFIVPMLESLGAEAPDVIEVNLGIPLLSSPVPGAADSHTFLSITGAAHQIATLAAALGRLDPEHEAIYRRNARQYKARLRRLLGAAVKGLKQMRTEHLRIGTVHAGYGYLFQELGLDVHAVVQPRHGIQPSPRQLSDSISRIEEADVNLLFTEMDYAPRFVEIVRESTGTRIARLSHVSRGAYTAALYEVQMANNLQAILDAVRAMQ